MRVILLLGLLGLGMGAVADEQNRAKAYYSNCQIGGSYGFDQVIALTVLNSENTSTKREIIVGFTGYKNPVGEKDLTPEQCKALVDFLRTKKGNINEPTELGICRKEKEFGKVAYFLDRYVVTTKPSALLIGDVGEYASFDECFAAAKKIEEQP